MCVCVCVQAPLLTVVFVVFTASSAPLFFFLCVCVCAFVFRLDVSLIDQDVSGVFVVLICFVSAATLSWCFRRSPWAKNVKARRQRANGGDAGQNVLDSYAKMSRRQQKSFAMQATVAMLQDSRVRVLVACQFCVPPARPSTRSLPCALGALGCVVHARLCRLFFKFHPSF